MTVKKPVPHHLRCDYDIPVTAAVQALSRGEASPEQQKWVLDWVINVAAGTYNQSFSELGDRETVFAEGRRFVGLQLVKQLHLSINALRKATQNE